MVLGAQSIPVESSSLLPGQHAGLSLGLEVRRVFYWVFSFFFLFFLGGRWGGGVVQVGGLTNIQGVRGNNSEVYKRILVHVHTGKSSQIQILLKQL